MTAGPSSGDPHWGAERRSAARHLIANPLTCAEHDEETFRLIRRHEVDLDRWFTQRLGYRLHVASDTARLWKSGYVPPSRPLRTSAGRPLHQLEYILLILALASTVAGPAVISLRDLIDLIRSAAAEIDLTLSGDATERRALVTALRWMIDHGLAGELHARVESYATDEDADAVLRIRPDRITLLPLPVLAGDDEDLLVRAGRRDSTRQWLRARLVEDPVVYRVDLAEEEWNELRRRLGEEGRFLHEMFGLTIEARAEGVAAIDPDGSLADQPFPTGGTVSHAALLLLSVLQERRTEWWDEDEIQRAVLRLAGEYGRFWAKDLVAAPDRLARRAVDLLVGVRLAERRVDPAGVKLLAAAARFAPSVRQDTLL
ncbi:MAG: TIGR02678 family protein [Actinomycetota bacterium]|nr:TIGR02678 family protein [Actinomycetota bacterium]